MAYLMRIVLTTCVFFCLTLLLIGDNGVEARGGRGGGGRGGGSRGGGSRRSGSRSGSSSSISRSRVRYGPSSPGWKWQTAGSTGYIYGYSHYQTRSYYRRNPSTAPSICVNKYDYNMDNGTNFELLICPRQGQDDSYFYCCGYGDREWCCSTWQRPGTIVGLVFGIFFGLMFIIWCVHYLMQKPQTQKFGNYYRSTFRKTKHKGTEENQESYTRTAVLQPIRTGRSNDNPPAPCDPAVDGIQPYPPVAATPYPTDHAAPYSTGDVAPYPGGGAAPYPTVGPAPYPTGSALSDGMSQLPEGQGNDGLQFTNPLTLPNDPSRLPSAPPPPYPGPQN